MRLEPGETKNGDGRTLKFDQMAELKALLEAQRDEHDRLKAEGRIVPWLFHRDGKQIRSLDSAWRTACRRAGCPGRLLHDLRRTVVRDLVRAGVSQTVARSRPGI